MIADNMMDTPTNMIELVDLTEGESDNEALPLANAKKTKCGDYVAAPDIIAESMSAAAADAAAVANGDLSQDDEKRL